MVTIYDVNPSELIKKTSDRLKEIDSIKAPEWAQFVKTGVSKERPPIEKDWWYTRAASVLRKVYVLGPVGVSKLRKKYGGKKNRGHKPERFYKGSGNILRKVLQQLEKAELIKQTERGVHKGRGITPKGKKFLDGIAKELFKKTPEVKEEVKVEKKVESKPELKKENTCPLPQKKEQLKQEVKTEVPKAHDLKVKKEKEDGKIQAEGKKE
ncbi:MAG: 30S ribosomal protein S19e [Nanoarchaeota archaeon]|jgi:small subunit ribosomal protein S19e|nr:30S ribosomal protein S19e [Nanoarchaeota archaeon]|tara:strand:- start:35239 stop:35868 length:630 start_codon:yes stop_codon:yes gene_type:complete